MKGFSNPKANSSYIKLQGYLSLNQNLFIGDPEGEDIWVYLMTYGKTEYVTQLRENIEELKKERLI